MCSLLELASANLDWEHDSTLAPVKTFEGYRFPSLFSLSDPRDRCVVQAGVEVAWMHSNHLLAAITQALTRLPIDVENRLVLVEQEETIHRVVDEGAKTRLARAELILCPLAFGHVAHQAQKPTSVLLELADASLHREGGAILAPVARLECDWFPGEHALLQPLDGCVVETDVEIALMFADQFFPAVAQSI